MRARSIAVICGCFLILASATAAPAGAQQVTCGAVVTSDIVLQSDLTCDSHALVVPGGRTEPITIDLNGHTITGPYGDPDPSFPFGPSAVWVPGMSSAEPPVTVRNGTIQGFVNAVAVDRNPDVTLAGLTLRDNTRGLVGSFAVRRLTIRDSTIVRNSTVLMLHTDSTGALIENNTIMDSGGMSFTENGGITIRGNSIVRSGTIWPFLSGRGLVIEGNLFADSDVPVVLSHLENDNVLIRHNVFRGNRMGLQLGGRPLDRFSNAVIEGNFFINNLTAGLYADLDPADGDDVVGLEIRGNQFLRNGLAPDGTVDSRGEAVDDGLHVVAQFPVPTVTIARNHAIRNAGLGIETAGVIDGGGNLGRANGDARQCVGVVCR